MNIATRSQRTLGYILCFEDLKASAWHQQPPLVILAKRQEAQADLIQTPSTCKVRQFSNKCAISNFSGMHILKWVYHRWLGMVGDDILINSEYPLAHAIFKWSSSIGKPTSELWNSSTSQTFKHSQTILRTKPSSESQLRHLHPYHGQAKFRRQSILLC